MDLRATARFAGKFVKGRLEEDLAEADAGQSPQVEFMCDRFRVDPRRAKNFERTRRSAAFGNVRGFEQAHTGVNRRGIECWHIWRRHYPRQAGVVEPHRAFPIFHW